MWYAVPETGGSYGGGVMSKRWVTLAIGFAVGYAVLRYRGKKGISAVRQMFVDWRTDRMLSSEDPDMWIRWRMNRLRPVIRNQCPHSPFSCRRLGTVSPKLLNSLQQVKPGQSVTNLPPCYPVARPEDQY